MKKSNIIVFCMLFAFVCVMGNIVSAKSKNPLKKIDNPFDKKDDKKKEKKAAEKKSKREASQNAQINAMSAQLFSLEQPDGLDNNVKAQKLKETPIPETKKESQEQGKAIDGSPVTYITTTERFKASAAFDQQIMLNPGKDVIYPGVVIMGSSIADGTYKEITKGTRRPITISYDITDAKKRGTDNDGVVVGTFVPSLSNYRTLHNKILGQDISGVSSVWSFEDTTVYSESDFEIKFNMGVGYNTGLVEASVKNGFNFAKGSKKNKYMIKFMQTFYTVDVDQGKDTFLYEKFDIADFKGYRPVYVSSIAYGRLAYLTIESDETWDKIKNDLSVAVDIKTGTKIDGDLGVAVNNLKKNSKINITFIGATNVVTDLDGFLNELANGGFSKKNPGQIVAYKLRFVDDNSVANTVYNDEYTVTRTVEQAGKGIDVTFTLYRIKTNANDGAGAAMELFGNLEVQDDTTKNKKSLWSYSKSSPHKVKEKDENIVQNTSFTYRVPNESSKFDFYLSLGEKDGSNSDSFTDAMEMTNANTAKTIMVNSLQDGKDIVIKSYAIGKKGKISSEWVEYYIRVNKKYFYSENSGSEDLSGLPFQPTKNISIDFTAVSGGSALTAVPMGVFAGTKGQSKALELINFELKKGNIGFEYMGHIQDVGDTAWASFTGGKGSLGRFGKRMEGVAFRLTPEFAAKYDIYYRGHIQNIGDTQWYKNGEFCGTRGKSLRIEGLQLIIVDK